jgi:hypothetical protein
MDSLELLNALYARHIELFHLNFGEIIFLLKVNEAERIQQHKLIHLLIFRFKMLTKTATIRLNSVIDHVVRSTLTVFMQGRNILDGVVILHETAHEMHRKS